MPLRVHVFQHVPFEGLGILGSSFREIQTRITTTCFFDGQNPPPSADFDLLVVMGGPMGVYDEEQYPWLGQEKQVLKEALAEGKPVLGICLGAQLLAEVLGGAITQNPHKEIGWWPVERLSEASGNWVARLFPERFTSFHWHGDTFAIPPGATPLFRSGGCAHQGFVWGERAIGLQFHPEITPDDVEAWLEHGDEELRSASPYVQKPEQIRGRPEDFKANNEWVAGLCREWIRRARAD